ncbi:MAG: uroporphyrinogen-III C-methyltransferase [Rhodospirillales bacterium]|nr:uroporphyrinogen-III C-methyltransferase [Alphaproteobacteria bacterium]MBL6948841.1 uroporphyrinogen-III C-methyltransferase [Rhodospirillales bacterium]
MQEKPVVYLVGAGPGDPDLMTIKGKRILENADVVVYDRLVSEDILGLVGPGTARIDVGKQPGLHSVPQDEINALLVRLAEEGKRRVVRLKGGDPFTFGRGGEEAQALSEHGIDVEVVPGVTAASGCAASLGIPLTHRGLANGVRYVTGHCREDAPLNLDWSGLADPDTTLVVYMGKANIGRMAQEILDQGMEPSTPVCAVANGTTENQRHLFSTLDRIGGMVRTIDFDGPVLFIIGSVVTLAAAYQEEGEEADAIRTLHNAGLA